MHFAVIPLVCLAILWLLLYWTTKDRRKAIQHIPGPYNIPILGAVHIAYKFNLKNFFTKGREFSIKHGSVVKFWIFHRCIIVSEDAELNEQILTSTSHITKHRLYGILHKWLGTGLLMSDGRKWHARRKIITPTFHFKILEEFVEVFDQHANILVECLAEKADGRMAFNVYPHMCAAALDIVAETAMGTKVNAQTDKQMQYTAAVNEMLALTTWRLLRIHLNSEIIFTLMYPHKKLREMKLIRIMREFTTSIILEKRQALENTLRSAAAACDGDDIGAKKRMALLDVLLQSTIDGQPLTDEDIREEVETFMFEGHDTTSSALSFSLHLLARHPQVQNKLLAEIRRVYGEDRSITLINLNELKYMECVIKECLRFFPPIPFIGREIKEDFKYKHSRLGEGFIPAGIEFMVAICGTLRSPQYFDNPNEFRPERHENVNNDGNNTFRFIPFSAGPRNCIGQKFAMLEMKTILTKIIREYELLPLGEDVQLVLSIVLRSANGMQLGIRKRVT